MKTVGEIVRLSTAFLQERGVAFPRRMAEELLAHAFQERRLDLYLAFDRPVEERELVGFRALLKRAARHEPLQYLIGEVEFYHTTLRVTPDVLIPRPETEELVERIVRHVRSRVQDLSGMVLWDLCTGSGCIAIALKKALPSLQVIATDLSSRALAIARRNAALNQVDILFEEGDLTAPLQGRQVHFVVSNPPYVSVEEFKALDASVREFEPREALVAEEEGRAFYRRLSRELPSFLHAHGELFLEIGSHQADVESFFTNPPWIRVERILDRSEKDRFIFLEKE